MNLNQSLINKKRNKTGRNGYDITNYKPKQIMGPPVGLPPKRKTNSTSSSATNWGRNPHSVHNNSTMRSGSTTISTSETESRIIVALTEGRGEARCEVGMAAIDISCPTLILCQISDAQSYINTLTKINILNPTDILVPSTFLEMTTNRLIERIRKQFPKIKILGVPRKTFNKTNGMDRILQLCLPEINAICVGLQHKYYALAAASALTTYLQNNLCIYYTKESVNVIYQESEGYAIIDVSTADRLELVSSTKPMQASRFSTLFGVLNYCFTRVGARLLRSTILQPPSRPNIIEQTSQCVTELIKHPQMLLSLQAILQKLSNIDQLLTITSIGVGTGDGCSIRQLNYLLLLNGLIDLIEPLKSVVETCQQPFFRELNQTLESDNFNVISTQIRKMIHPAAQFAKSDAGITQRCYAIKSGINGLLDLVRKTYSERLNDTSEYVKHLGNKYNLPLSLNNNNTKGYHIVLKLTTQQKRSFKKTDLPPEFIQVYRLAGSCTMKTLELINYSTRLEDIMFEIIKISNVMVQKTVVDLKQHIGFFYKLCEDVARLDMLQSLAEASKRGHYVKPKFGGFTEIVQARHPMLEMLIGDQRVANSISVCKDYNVQIITGPNGSGKSIYIRQIMLLQVMAQVGSYIPAESALIKPMDRMFARIYLEDNMEYGASAFILEMKEVKYMMTLLTENSLFIIDELCRSTSADEGAALAMAICEKFCTTPVFLFVTTHYTALGKLADIYLNVKTWQMETISSGDNPRDLILDYKYRLIPGVTQLKHYGIYIVKNIWPQSILEDVYQILQSLKSSKQSQNVVAMDEKVRLKYKLESNMRKLKSRNKLTMDSVKALLRDYQNELEKLGVHIDFNQEPEEQLETAPNDFETTSYINLSNFLREDNDNVNKLIPEVSIAEASSDITFNLSDNNDGNSYVMTPSFECPSYHEFESQALEMGLFNDYVADDCKKSTSTGTLWGAKQLSQNDLEEIGSMMEDLESCKDSFFSGDDDFDFTQPSSCYTPDEPKNQHIFPVVKVIEGPEWISDSSCNTTKEEEEMLTEMSESISYSPLQSPSSSTNCDNKGLNTSSSSLHFVAENNTPNKIDINLGNSSNTVEKSTSDENLNRKESTGSGDTNLEDISRNRNLENVENSKQSSNGDKTTTSNDTSSKKTSSKSKALIKPLKKFIPPKKLTKKEILEEFNEQDRKVYETDISDTNFSKYLSQILKRPSVKQVQQSQHLAYVRRTENGVEVIPTKPQPPKRKFPFKRNISSCNNVDVSIFSDQYAKSFDEFLNSNERDVKRFKFNLDTQKENTNPTFNFKPQSISEYATNVPFSFKSENVVQLSGNLTPDGYYKQNRDDIDGILTKYLKQDKVGPDFGDRGVRKGSIFESCGSFDDLEL